jgi:methylated-DNA-protein-cysteine methyltransferase-like protein
MIGNEATISRGATFYDRVYAYVRSVPPGSVVTYGQVAVVLGSPAAARAVGYALSYLGPATDVPWWRVINARGGISLKGRGAAADRQRELLEAEGVAFGADGRTDLGVFRWWGGFDDEK